MARLIVHTRQVDTVSILVGALAGLLGGGALVYLLLRPRFMTGDQIKTLHEAEYRKQREEELATKLTETSDQLRAKSEECQKLEVELTRQTTGSEEQKKGLEKQIQDLRLVEQNLKETFANLSHEAMIKSSDELIKRADQLLKTFEESNEHEFIERKTEIRALLDPMREKMSELDRQSQELEKNRARAYGELKEQITNLGKLNESVHDLQKDTVKLTKALQDPGQAGKWGEMILEKVLEKSGLDSYLIAATQATLQLEDSTIRPDCIIRLPGDRKMIIDSKTPLKAYMEGLDCESEERRSALFRQHSNALHDHAKALAKRDYTKIGEATDFVILFVPSEAAFRTALEHRPSILEEGIAMGIVYASPATLLAVLRAVGYSWRHETLGQEAKEIQKLGRELVERFAVFADHLNDMGNAINRTSRSFNKMRSSLETRIVPTLRKFKESGIESNRDLPELTVADGYADVSPTLPELDFNQSEN